MNPSGGQHIFRIKFDSKLVPMIEVLNTSKTLDLWGGGGYHMYLHVHIFCHLHDMTARKYNGTSLVLVESQHIGQRLYYPTLASSNSCTRSASQDKIQGMQTFWGYMHMNSLSLWPDWHPATVTRKTSDTSNCNQVMHRIQSCTLGYWHA